ncbi:YihY/virulence factor BrkB family protein [Nocardia cyriacigeorgica]|uniref:YihY/virulence factor BrkB family protein n=1 Tax=Nocardia cyriacigeorgica TaxID=135487 RepID=A0A6P1CLX7_9NOCA|nr:YihY/virulence factor BrkB family protein [Nocardia cyriacigeorgica]MBF6080856.1 YihY/virulence factor BrkB family protein [Nocardia cyriacigeorgica]MBF6284738.1 YihY/virulence factor BrkB family protein [Nocardia cyriacigeorgica]NEW31185.1 YihY/virulence factor BrkB family protein [Nocardia cyriacigeorgica]
MSNPSGTRASAAALARRAAAGAAHAGTQTGRLVARVAVKAWQDSIFAKSAAAAFWQTMSLAPLLLGVLGSLGYVGGWFGPDTVEIVESKILTFSRDLFNPTVVQDLIEPTVRDVLGQGRAAFVSVGFVLSLWAGSSAMATFVDAIVEAHDQQDARHPVWQRIFALLLYVQFLVAAVFILPLIALGPALIGRALPDGWREPGLRLIDAFYYPGVGLLLMVGLTTLYKLALHTSLPWHRLFGGALVAGVFFMAASEGLRRYLGWVTRTGVSYGALATPIAFLLFTFFLAFAVIVGAEFNAAVQEFWPARATRVEQVKAWLAEQVRGDSAAPAGDTMGASAGIEPAWAQQPPGPDTDDEMHGPPPLDSPQPSRTGPEP